MYLSRAKFKALIESGTIKANYNYDRTAHPRRLTVSNKKRYRNIKVHVPASKTFSQHICAGAATNKNRCLTSTGGNFGVEVSRDMLEFLIKLLVYKDYSDKFKESTEYLNMLPCKQLNIKDSTTLTTLPLRTDLDFNTQLELCAFEALPLPKVFTELRAYDYLVLAFQRFTKDLWLATYDEAKRSYNKETNIFNFFGFHNLFNRRAAKLLFYFHADPYGLLRKLTYKNAVIAERRFGYLGKFLESLELDNWPEITYNNKIKRLFRSQASQDYFDELREVNSLQNSTQIPVYMQKSEFMLYHSQLQALQHSSVVYDYRTPLLYAAARLVESNFCANKGHEETLANIIGNDDTVDTKILMETPTKIASTLTLGLPLGTIGHKLDFEKANRKGSLLASDDLVEPYPYLQDLNSDITSVDDSNIFSAWGVLPFRSCLPVLNYNINHSAENRSKIFGEETDVTIRLDYTDSAHSNYSGNIYAIRSIVPRASILYPKDMVYDMSNFVWFNDPCNNMDIPELSHNHQEVDSNLNLALTYNDKLGSRLSAVQNSSNPFFDDSCDCIDPITTVLSANSIVLQGMSTLLIEYLTWVDTHFSVDTMSTQERHLLQRARKLAKLCAKHGNPIHVTNILKEIADKLKPLPASDF